MHTRQPLHGFAGYRFKRERTSAFLHVFMGGDQATPWTGEDAECIEAEVVFRIRRDSGAWPAFQSEIHFAPATDRHTVAADEIIIYFQRMKTHPLQAPLPISPSPKGAYETDENPVSPRTC